MDCPKVCCGMSKRAWKDAVYDSVEDRETLATPLDMNSTHRSKFWGKVGKNFACFTGEIGRRGALVPEPYLDDRNEPIGRRLKLMCRAGCLPILKRVAREAKLPASHGTCKMCNSGRIEDIEHFVMDCKAYSQWRSKMLESSLGPRARHRATGWTCFLGKARELPRQTTEQTWQ